MGERSGDEAFYPKRRFPRFETSHLLTFTYELPDHQSNIQGLGKTCSLSEGGLLFETDHAIPAGTRLELQFTLKEHLLNAIGESVYFRDRGQNVFGIGVRFVSISEEHQQIIRKHAEHYYPRFDARLRPDNPY